MTIPTNPDEFRAVRLLQSKQVLTVRELATAFEWRENRAHLALIGLMRAKKVRRIGRDYVYLPPVEEDWDEVDYFSLDEETKTLDPRAIVREWLGRRSLMAQQAIGDADVDELVNALRG